MVEGKLMVLGAVNDFTDLHASQRYFFQPLDASKSEIRTIQIDIALLDKDVVPCTPKVVSLDSNPRFIALSYEWSPPSQVHTDAMTLKAPDGQELRLRPNLTAFLRHLGKYVNGKTSEFWIDSVCIDQDDADEKATQVPLMSRIYGKADSTIAWLGTERDNSTDAIRIVDEHDAEIRNSVTMNDHQRRRRRLHKSLQSTSWRSLGDLLERSYFRRGWIVQELALSRWAILLCGDSCMQFLSLNRVMDDLDWIYATYANGNSLTRMTEVSNWLKGHPGLVSDAISTRLDDLQRIGRPNLHPAASMALRLIAQGAAVRAVGRLRREKLSFLGPPNLLDILLLLRMSKTTDPRDKVYAFAGLADTGEELPLQVDYIVSWQEVYRRTCVHIISSCQSLDVLLSCGSGAEGLPTWVPNWSDPIMDHVQNPKSKGPELISMKDAPGTLQPMLTSTYSGASKASSDHVTINGALLTVRATFIAKTCGCSTGDYGHSDGDPLPADFFFRRPSVPLTDVKFHRLYDRFEGRFRGQLVSSLMFATAGIFGNQVSLKVMEDWKNGKYAKGFRSDERKEFLDVAGQRHRTFIKIVRPREICVFKEDEERLEAYHIPGLDICATYGFCRVRPQVGDDIFVVHGCRMPLILRRNITEPHRWSLVGAAWVIGLMNQEAIGKLPDVDITIE